MGIKVSLDTVWDILAADGLVEEAPPPLANELPFRFREISWEVPSSMALTTMPPDDPPQAAKDPMGVKLALSLRSMIMGWPFSMRIF